MDSAKYFFPPGYFEQVYGNNPNFQQVPVAIPGLIPKFGNETHGIQQDAPYVKNGEQGFMAKPYQNNGIMPPAQRGPQDRNQQYQNQPGGPRRENIFRNQRPGHIEANETKPYPVDETLTSVPRFIPPNQQQAGMHVQGGQQARYVPRQQARGKGRINGARRQNANRGVFQGPPADGVVSVFLNGWEAEKARREELEAQAAMDRMIYEQQAANAFQRNVRRRMEGSKTFLNGKEFTIVTILELPSDGISGMNEGIRVLKDTQGIIVVEKKLKMCSPEKRERAEFEKKALNQIVKAGGSPNVNRIYEAFWIPGSATSSLILEYCNRGNLEDRLQTYRDSRVLIPEKDCLKTLYDLASALCMCHYGIKDPMDPSDKVKDWNTICHLDIKPQNIFLDYQGPSDLENNPDTWPRVVLGDFGCSVTRDDIMSRKVDHKRQPYGTPCWFPPEGDANDQGIPGEGGQKVKGAYGKFTDIWQIGGIIQVMCRLMLSPSMHWVDKKEGAGPRYSSDMNEAVNKIMVRDIDLRPTALDVATAIKGLMDSRGY